MNTNLERYFELIEKYKDASERLDALREAISREKEVGTHEARQEPEYKELDAEATRIYWEADALTPHVIRTNLQIFGIDDMLVTGFLRSRDGQLLDGKEVLLSELCGLRSHGFAERLGVDGRDVEFCIIVKQDGLPVGHVDSDGRFNYEKAPNLRTALGWQIATDGGRVRLIEFFHLEQAATLLLDTIHDNGTSKNAFFGSYFAALSKVFVYKSTSRFGDGHCGAAMTLWHVATRELGEEHPGYTFVC